MYKLSIIFILLFIFMQASVFSQSLNGFKLIVNSENPVETMSIDQISKTFFKKISHWENGARIMPVDLTNSSTIRVSFSKSVLGKNVSAVKAFWQKQIFSGRGVPPPEKRNEKDVLQFVSENLGAIGYVSVKTSINGSGVKTLKII